MKRILVAAVIFLLITLSITPMLFFKSVKADSSADAGLVFIGTADPQLSSWYPSTSQLTGLANDINTTTAFGKVDFVYDLGDFTQDDVTRLDDWKTDWVDKVPLPLMPVTGNHDVVDYHPDGTNSNPYRLLWKELNESEMVKPTYAFMKDGVLFLVVGCQGRHFEIQKMQQEWVEWMVSQYPNTTTVIFTHVPVRNTTALHYSGNEYRELNNDTWWHNLLENNPQINIIMNGHNHKFVASTGSGGLHSGNSGNQIYYVNQGGANCVCVEVCRYQTDDTHAACLVNITSNSITVKTWDYSSNSWSWQPSSYSISTTYNPDAEDWYSFPIFFEDNQTKVFNSKILSRDVTLQLIGQSEIECFENANLDFYSNQSVDGTHTFYPWWVYFSQDNDIGYTQLHGTGSDMKGQMDIDAGEFVSFPFKTATGVDSWDSRETQSSYSQGGYPYVFGHHLFGGVPPNAEYTVSVTCRAVSSPTTMFMRFNCTQSGDIYSTLPNSSQIVFDNITVCTTWTTYTTNYTQLTTITDDDDGSADCLQMYLENTGSNELEIKKLSIKRRATATTTQDFHVKLGSVWYNHSGTLSDGQYVNYTVNPVTMADANGDIVVHADIDGNKRGWCRLIYHPPLLFCRNAKFYLDSITNGNVYKVHCFDISATSNTCKFMPFLHEYNNLSVDTGSVKTSSNGYYTWSATSMSDVWINVTYGDPLPSGDNNNLNFTDICGQQNNTQLTVGSRWGNCTAPTLDDVPDGNAGVILNVEWYQVRVANNSNFSDVFINETGLSQWWNLTTTVDYTGQHYYQYRCKVKVRSKDV